MLHYLVNTLTITQASQDIIQYEEMLVMLWWVEEVLCYLPNSCTVTLAWQDIIQYGVGKMLDYLLGARSLLASTNTASTMWRLERMLQYLVNTLAITQASQDLMLWRVERMLHYLVNTLTITQASQYNFV